MITQIDKNTALVLIDLQKAMVKMPFITPIKEILENVSKLISAFRIANLPIVFVTVDPSKVKVTRTEVNLKTSYVFTDDDMEIVPELNSEPNDIFVIKHTLGAFHETSLDEEFRKRSITGIVLAGISTSIGVEGTARSASDYGLNITFSNDAISDRNAEAHRHSFTNIFPRLGEIGDTNSIIEMLVLSKSVN